MGSTAVQAQGARVVDPGRRFHHAPREGGHSGHHLEDGAGLVDAAHDRVHEPPRGFRPDSLVVVAVVARIRGLGVDRARVWIHHDGRNTGRPVGDGRREQLLFEGKLQPGVDGERDVHARRTCGFDLALVQGQVAGGAALGEDHGRLAAQRRLVVLLDAVLPHSIRVDESQHLRREGRVGTSANLRIDPYWFRFQCERRECSAGETIADAIGDVGSQTVGEDDVGLGRGHLGGEGGGGGIPQPEEVDQGGRDGCAPVN